MRYFREKFNLLMSVVSREPRHDYHEEDNSPLAQYSGLQIISGGTEKQRLDIFSQLNKLYVLSMGAYYHNPDSTKLAVVFAGAHDAFEGLNFDKVNTLLYSNIDETNHKTTVIVTSRQNPSVYLDMEALNKRYGHITIK